MTPTEAGTVEATAACEAGNHHRCRGTIVSLTAAHGTPWVPLPHQRRPVGRARAADVGATMTEAPGGPGASVMPDAGHGGQ